MQITNNPTHKHTNMEQPTDNTANRYSQVVVWPHTLLDGNITGFIQFIHEEFDGTRAVDVCEHKVSSDRTDVLFVVHSEDIPKFAVPRLAWGMRWLEDVMNNDESYRPPSQYKRTW